MSDLPVLNLEQQVEDLLRQGLTIDEILDHASEVHWPLGRVRKIIFQLMVDPD